MNIQQQQQIERSLAKNVADFANACNVAADRRDVASWERVGYLAECCQGDCAALGRVTEKQEWDAVVVWAYHQAHDAMADDLARRRAEQHEGERLFV